MYSKIGIYTTQADYYGVRSNEYLMDGGDSVYSGGGSSTSYPVATEPIFESPKLYTIDPYTAPMPDPVYIPISGDTQTAQEAPAEVLDTNTVPQQQSSTLQTGNTSTGLTTVYLYLHFKDEQGKDLAVNGRLIDLATGNVLSEIKGSYEAEIKVNDVPAQQLGVEFFKFGYKTVKSTVDQLMQLPDPKTIYFQKGMGTVILFNAAALLLLYLIYEQSKKRKKVGAFDAEKTTGIIGVLALGVGLFLAYKLVKKILDFLGVTKDRDTADLDNAATDPNSFWNPMYWKNIKPAGASYSYAFTSEQAAALAQQLYDAFGAFNDNEEQAINVFKQCRTQANASYICYIFQSIYGEDCLTFLRGGWWPQDRLSDTDVNTINRYVSNLKEY